MNRTLAWLPLLLLGLARPAQADWPVFGHDVQRTARTDGNVNIAKPVKRWRTYLGGYLDSTQAMSADLDGDGTVELLLASAGRVLAVHADNTTAWTSPIIDAWSLIDLVDLDGDGQMDVLALTSDGIVALAAKTGTVLWNSKSWKGMGFPDGYVGAVRLADLDGDGNLDLFFVASWCGGGSNTDRRLGTALSFRAPASFDAPKVLFDHKDPTNTERDYLCGAADVLADVDGDGILDWVALGTQYAYVYATRDLPAKGITAGQLVTTSENLGNIPYGLATVDIADLDKDGRDDLVLYTNNTYNPSVNSRRVFVVGWHLDPSTMQSVFGSWWEHGVADLSKDVHGFADTSLHDLDGDGKLEVTTSFQDGQTGIWTLEVYDAATGTEKATMSDTGLLLGVAEADAPFIATKHDDELRIYRYASGALTLSKSIPSATAVSFYDHDRARRVGTDTHFIMVDACGDSTPELLGYTLDANHQPTGLTALSVLDGVAPCPMSYPALTGETFLTAFPLSNGQIAAVRSSGYLTTLKRDDGLVPTNLELAEVSVLGLQVGGYYSGGSWHPAFPIVADIGSDSHLLAVDSRNFLVDFDAHAASLIKPPAVRWQNANVNYPSAFDVLGGPEKEILAWQGNSLIILDGTGKLLATHTPFASPTRPQFEPLAAQLVGDARPEILLPAYDDGIGRSAIYAIDSTSGDPVWNQPFSGGAAGCLVPDIALAPFTTGAPDVITANCSLLVAVSGDTGLARASNTAPPNPWPPTAISADVDGDGSLDLLTTGAFRPYAFKSDLSLEWSSANELGPSPYQYNSIVECPGTGWRYAGTLGRRPFFFILDPTTGQVVNGASPGVVLAGGGVYATEADALAAGHRPGSLGNVTGVKFLRGTDTPAFLVGSTDGYLYALDACTGSLVWALDFQAPVGQAVLADLRGGGREQIVVSVADGYLYGVDDENYPSPTGVRDVDPTIGLPDTQVDQITTVDTLYVAWDAVPGATSYECAVVDQNGLILTAGADFVPCGTSTYASLSGLALQDGMRYRQAVRAVGPMGVSVETLSPGVIVHLPLPAVPADAGTDGGTDGATTSPPEDRGCACDLSRGAPAPTGAALVLALVALLFRYAAAHRRAKP